MIRVVRRTLVVFTFAVAAASIAGAFVAGPLAWGFDHWSFFPRAVFAVAALLLVALLLPWGRRAAVRVLDRPVAILEESPRARVAAAVTIGALALAFWFGREVTFFLSDGELLIRVIENNLRSSFAADQLSYHIQVWLHDLSRGAFHVNSATASFRIVSILSGMVWLAASFATVGGLTGRRWERLLLGGLLATLGLTRLFYGYVETSPLLAAASAVYLWRAVVYLRTGRGALSVAVSLLVAIAMHLVGVLLLPSYLFLIARGPSGAPRRTLLLGAGVPLAAAGGLVLARALSAGGSAGRLPYYLSAFVPLTGPLGPRHAYTLLSPAHWNDFLEQQLLLGPFGVPAVIVILAAMLLSRRRSLSPENAAAPAETSGLEAAAAAGFRTSETFLLWIVAPITLLSFLYGRELGGARDWDLLSGAAPAATLWVGLVVMRVWGTAPGEPATRTSGKKTPPARGPAFPLPEITVMMLAVSLFHLVPWILVDAGAARSLGHFEARLGPRAAISRFARAYGYEELGRYHLERGDLAPARDWFARAVEIDSSDVKALVPLANTLKLLGETDRAIPVYAAIAQRQPASAISHLQLAEALSQAGRPGQAIPYYRTALRLDPTLPAAGQELGNACFAAGHFAAADSAYAAALDRQPDSADLWCNRGLARESLGDVPAAIEFYRKALSLAPEHPAAAFDLGTLYLRNGRPAEAIPFLEQCRQHDPSAVAAAVNLALAQAYLGQAAAVNRTLASLPRLDGQIVHAYMDAAAILAGQGRRADALGLLAACRGRDDALARSTGVIDLMNSIGR